MKTLRAILGSLLILSTLLLLEGCSDSAAPPSTEGATVLRPAKPIPPFELTHHSLGAMNLESFKGKWSLFFFGYTRCPDVCPTELFTLAEMMRKIEENPAAIKEDPQVVFVSVDPQQDIPEALQKYAGYYHPSFLGITGEQKAVDQLARSMGARYERVYHVDGKELAVEPGAPVPEGLGNAYLINHSATIVLLDPNAEISALLPSPHQPEVMIRDIAAIQNSW